LSLRCPHAFLAASFPGVAGIVFVREVVWLTYNRFHDPKESSVDIAELRRLHVEMDAAAAAYGWGDLELGHGFHETKQGLRYTISEAARREVLDRLLRLNHERYAEEVAEGLHDKGAKKALKGGEATKLAARLKANSSPTPQLALDLDDAPAATLAPASNGNGDTYRQFTALLAQRGALTNGEAQAALGVDGAAARALLRRLVDEGLAAVEGQKRGTRYVRRRA